jgi:LysR family glycine cleavage system transcriptional activator
MPETSPPLASLHAFVLVAKAGGLAAAAEKLNVTQPAVSKRVRALEALLGVALIDRGANSMRLTEAGRRYADALAAAFAEIEAATKALSAGPRAPLRVRTHNTWATGWLIPRLARFRARHPELEVAVTVSLKPVDFGRDAVDIAIVTGEQPPIPAAARLQQVTIAPFAIPAVARRAKRGGLGGITLLGSQARPDDWEVWARAQGMTLPAAPVLYETTTLAIQAALEGLGMVIVSPFLVGQEVRKRRLAPLAAGAVETTKHYWLLLPPGPPRPAAAAFRSWLLEEIASDAADP